MASNADFTRDLRPRIVVFGAGGAGGNAVHNMIASGLDGVEFVVANTDAQALMRAEPQHRLQLGERITEGLGAGARPEIGRKAAEDSIEDIAGRLKGAHMVFITAGMGGGTGTGAAPVIARAAREAHALTIAVVTKPFEFEGSMRMRVAEEGLRDLEREVDTLIVIPNQNLFRIATEKTTMSEAFALADQVLHSGVRGVTDLMTRPGLVNLDFADVRTVMNEMGKAMMGTGEASGERRASEAADAAVANPLLDDVTLKGARSVLINITGGPDMTLLEVDEAVNAIRAEIDPDANIIVGSALDDAMAGRLRVSVVATGMEASPRETAAREGVGPTRAPRTATGSFEHAEAPAPEPEREPAPTSVASFTFEPTAADPARDEPEEPEVEEAPVAEAEPEALEEPEPEEARHADSEPEEERPHRGGFSLFGRRRRHDEGDDEAGAEGAGKDGSGDDEDLEIPAFLRRQAN